MGHEPQTHRRATGRCIRVTLAAVAVTFGAVGCADDSETVVEAAQEGDFTEIVVGEPFEGTAEVEEILSPYAFRLIDTLVITPAPHDAVEGQLTIVEGTVREAELDTLAEELGIPIADLDVDDDLLVVADTVEPSEFEGAPIGDD